jgi:hypothetical protein
MQVGLVVLVFPCGAAAVAAVAGDRDQAVAARLVPVVALHQLGVARGLAPVALNAGAGFAERHFFLIGGWCRVLGHGAALDGCGRLLFGRAAVVQLSPLGRQAGFRRFPTPADR